MCATLVVTAEKEMDFAASRLAARKQLAFYGSTPAYLLTMVCHGWEGLHEELNRLSKEGRRDDMTRLIGDDMLNEIADRLRQRLTGIADSVSITHNRCPDPVHRVDIVQELKAGG